MPAFFDQHLHSRHSFDSATDPQENVESALKQGLAGLTFTEHYDVHPNDWKDCCYDESAVAATIENLRSTYGDRIFIGKGIEICYQPEKMGEVVSFLRDHPFDMIILSVHYFSGLAIHRKGNWQGRSTEEVTRAYLYTVLDAVRWCRRLHEQSGQLFHVLGHLDLVKRYAMRWRDDYDAGFAAPLIDDILRTCLAAELVPEINTSGIRQKVGAPLPGPDVMKRYAELGGTAMSLGSDAHKAQDIGANFDVAAGMMRDSGITQTATFRSGKRIDRVERRE
ncbi:MAG: histidinol-phosphatase HisJ family protein [Planctomycetota bacterium]|jgi:histidinol-phosphatase (PHP family)